MSDKHEVYIRSCQAKLSKIARNTLPFLHARRFHYRTHRVEIPGAQGWVGQLTIVASHVIQNAPVGRFDQISEDWRIDEFAMPTIAGGKSFFIANSAREQGPDFQSMSHIDSRKQGHEPVSD